MTLTESAKESIKKDIQEIEDLFNKFENKIKGMKEYLSEINKLLEEK